jgi:diguanylate cyclase (GGDEF)-like protein/PAS domain S-box-containing protein
MQLFPGWIRPRWASLRRRLLASTGGAIHDAEIRALFEQMLTLADGQEENAAARARIRRFALLPAQQQADGLIDTYLAVEHELVDGCPPVGRAYLRGKLARDHESLLARSGLAIVFETRNKQRIALSRELVRAVATRAAKAFGNEPAVRALLAWLGSSVSAPQSPLASHRDVPSTADDARWLELYETVSKDFFLILVERAGFEAARRMYDAAFHATSLRFRFLPTFHVVVSMLPPALFDQKRLSVLERRHLFDMLRHRVDELEDSNRVLSDRNEVLAFASSRSEERLQRAVVELRSEIAQRRKAAQALRESEERYAIAVRGANDGLWDWDLVANRAYYSARLRAMLGWSLDQTLSDPAIWFRAMHPRDAPAAKRRLEEHLAGDSGHFESEHRMRHADGTYRWMLVRGVALRDVAGRPYRMAGSQTDIDDRRRAQDLLTHEALHDSLTGLPNRTLFFDRLRGALDRFQKQAVGYAVLFLDVDRFKVVNDSLGHAAGDELLIQLARRLQSCMRHGDTLSRLGGDEFTILVENVHLSADIVGVAERIAAALKPPLTMGAHEIFVTVSIGIALDSADYTQPEEVVRDADTALYRAKETGSARHVIFEPFMRDKVVERLSIETSLRTAVERRELELYVQPIVCLKTGVVRQLEALLRWNHAERGLVLPGDFIGIADETGMIVPIGEWVLEEACRLLRAVQNAHLPYSPGISVNLSPVQLAQPDIVQRIMAIVASSGVDPSGLALEITETALMEDPEVVSRKLHELREFGLLIFIDDFGSGYSSFEYLRRFPARALKLDKHFIQRLGSDKDNTQIVRSIVALGHHLGMCVIAEGVEDEEQAKIVRNLGCDLAQGYLYARPAPIDAVLEFLARRPPAIAASPAALLTLP